MIVNGQPVALADLEVIEIMSGRIFTAPEQTPVDEDGVTHDGNLCR